MKSTEIIQPTPITQPVAVDGTRNTIPEAATGTNNASIVEGFPDMTMISPTNGGLPPFGQDFNGLFYLSTDQKVYLQNGGYITFNQDVSDTIGGYPEGAILDYVTDLGTYAKVKSLIDDNTYNFIENSEYINGEYWQQLDYEGSFADVNLSNITDTAKISISGICFPSTKYIDLTLGATGTSYIAPSDGWYYIQKINGNTQYYINLGNATTGITVRGAGNTDNATVYCNLPVRKGETMTLNYNATGTTGAFRFYYAAGSESEA